MKIKLILILALATFTLAGTAQNKTSNEHVITKSKKKTEVLIGDKGELRIAISPKDANRIQKNGFVDYETFGAKGDGVTDDIDAIAAAHYYA